MQLAQAIPPAPHWVSLSAGGGQAVSGTQVLPLQHPLQVAGPQPAAVQTPFRQVVAPVQAAHAAPPAPHCELLSLPTGTQVLPLQQPVQLDGPHGVMQTPLVQTALPVHGAQTAPLVPHWLLLCPPVPTQVFPVQQPAMQLAGPHAEGWQLPFWQRFAPVQAAQATPPEPHWELFSLATGTQVLPLQQPAQLAGPQVGVQVPDWQVSVPVHAAQAMPPLPHWEFVSLPTPMQVVPAQQPVQLAGPQLPASAPPSVPPASGLPLSVAPLSGEPESAWPLSVNPPSVAPASAGPASPPPPSGTVRQTPDMHD
jgi:hypothetical protein